jgi:RHH-type transcriptional regulator, rel operon repressor / antitoxin RelB
MSKQAAIRIPDETYDRLQALALRTGRTSTFFIREAIEAHLDDLEDIYRAETVLAEHQLGKSKNYSLAEASRILGLDD